MLEMKLLGHSRIYLNGVDLRRKKVGNKPKNRGKALLLLYFLALSKKEFDTTELAFQLFPNSVSPSNRFSTVKSDLTALLDSQYLIWNTKLKTVVFDYDTPNMIDIYNFKSRTSNNSIEETELLIDTYKGSLLSDVNFRYEHHQLRAWIRSERRKLYSLANQHFDRLIEYYIHNHHHRLHLILEHSLNMLIQLHEVENRDMTPALHTLLYEDMRRQVVLLAMQENYTDIERISRKSKFENIQQLTKDLLENKPTLESLLQLLKGKSASQTPSAVSLPNPSVFINREHELKKLQENILHNNIQIIALVGMPGIGKTALALQSAYTMRNTANYEVVWMNLASQDLEAIVAFWYRYLEPKNKDLKLSLSNIVLSLRNIIAQRRIILIMDNADPESEAKQIELEKLLPQLIPPESETVLLLTTRNKAFASNMQAAIIDLEVFSERNSIELIATLTNNTVYEDLHSSELATMLGNLPLALTLASKYISKRNLELEQLISRLHMLESRLDDPALRRIDMLFEMVWEDLSHVLQHHLALISIFETRPFTYDIFNCIAVDVFHEHFYSEMKLAIFGDEYLVELVDRSLLQIDIQSEHYVLHTLLADFATKKLEKFIAEKSYRINSLNDIHMIATYYFGQFARTNKQDSLVILSEWENLKTALDWAVNNHINSALLSLVDSLNVVWFAHGSYTDARHYLNVACDAAIKEGEILLLGHFYLYLASTSIEQTDYVTATTHLENAREVFEELADQSGIATINRQLGRIALELDRFDDAHQHFNLSIALLQSIIEDGIADLTFNHDLKYEIFEAQYFQTTIHLNRNEFKQVQTLVEDVLSNLAILPKSRDQTLTKIKFNNVIGNMLLQQGKFLEAQHHYQESLNLCDSIEEQVERAVTQYYLGVVCRRLNQYEYALNYLNECIDSFRLMGDVKMLVRALRTKFKVLDTLDRTEQALSIADECLALLGESDFSNLYGRIGIEYGWLLSKANRLEEGCNSFRETLQKSSLNPGELTGVLLEKYQELFNLCVD